METLQSLAPDCLLLTKIDSDLEFSLVFFFLLPNGGQDEVTKICKRHHWNRN